MVDQLRHTLFTRTTHGSHGVVIRSLTMLMKVRVILSVSLAETRGLNVGRKKSSDPKSHIVQFRITDRQKIELQKQGNINDYARKVVLDEADRATDQQSE